MDEKLIQQLEESLYREVDDNREVFNFKKISKLKYKEILDELIDKGWIHEQIIDDVHIFFGKAFELYPELNPDYKSPEVHQKKTDQKESVQIEISTTDVHKALNEAKKTRRARNVWVIAFGMMIVVAVHTITNFRNDAGSKNRSTHSQPDVFFSDYLDSDVDITSVQVNDYALNPVEKIVLVRFNIGDNFTHGLIRASAKLDIISILQAIHESDITFREITVFGSFPMVDKYGNSSTDVVLKATFNRDAIKLVNWDNFLFDDVYDISDNTWFHPAFRDE